MFPSMLFWSLLQMSVTKGMGPVMLKPHIMSTLVPLYRSTPLRPKTSGASVSPNSCRALTLKKRLLLPNRPCPIWPTVSSAAVGVTP